VYSGKLGSLKRMKDDASEVRNGFDCGIGIDGFNDIQVGDVIESYEMREVKKSL
jgi:translation initiation factor IF-2